MIKTITHEDLIRYVYKETSENKNSLIENARIWDKELDSEISDFAFLKREIEKIEVRPSKRLTENLLFFSKNYSA
jgi:hypothetical protein